MRIDISNSSNLNRSNIKKLDSLKEGDIVKAKIVKVDGDVAKIDLGNGEIVEGKLDVSPELLKGKLINFLVKDVKDNVLLMSPVYEDIDFSNEFVLKNKNLIMDRILNLNNLTNDEKNLNIINNMISYKMPLKQEDIQAISRYTDKIVSLLNLNKGEEVQVLATKEPLDENINKLIKIENQQLTEDNSDSSTDQKVSNFKVETKSEELTKDSTVNTFKSFDTSMLEEVNINVERNDEFKNLSKQFLEKNGEDSNLIKEIEIKDKGNVSEFKDILTSFENKNNNDIEFKQITEQIKHEINNIFTKETTPQDIIQKLTFLVKSDIDVTLNNLSRLTEFIENDQVLNKEVIEVLKLAQKEGIIDEKTKLELLDKTRDITLKFDGKDSEKLDKFYKDIKEVSEKLLIELSTSSKSSEELNNKATKLNDTIDFYNKINDKTTMMLIPFTLNNREIENSLYVLSKKRVLKKSDSMKVYMSLNTNNLEKVKILCDFSYDRLNVNFKVKEEYMYLFERSKDQLSKILESKGYDNTFIYVNLEEEENILDLISYDDTINYMLNVKV